MRTKDFDRLVRETATEWSNQEIYDVFGVRLERVVAEKKNKLQLKLKAIWANRTWYAFRETGEQFEDDTMSFFFEYKKISKYSCSEMESILEQLDRDAGYLP